MKISKGTHWMAVIVILSFTTITNGVDSHIERGVYYPKPSKNIDEAKGEITRILNDKCVSIYDSANLKIKYKKLPSLMIE